MKTFATTIDVGSTLLMLIRYRSAVENPSSIAMHDAGATRETFAVMRMHDRGR